MVLLKFLLPVFFIFFSFGELARIYLPNSISFGVLDIVITLIITVWLFSIKKTSYQLKIPIIIFIIVGLVSLILNLTEFEPNEIFVGSLYLFRWTMYSFLYFVFKDIGKKYCLKIKNYFLLSGVFIVLLGFLQYFYYPNLKNLYYQGWDDHLYRLFSTFLDPNFTGVIIVLFIIFLFFRRQKSVLKKKNAYLLNLILIVSFTALILTYSRGAILMLIVSAFSYSILKRNYKVIGGLISVFVIVTIFLSPNFNTVNTDLFRTSTLIQRIDNTKQALIIFRKKPVFGVGFNNFRYARDRYLQKDWVPYPNHAGSGSDNSFALVLATTGIPGFFAYIFLLFKLYKLGKNNLNKTYFAWILTISITGLIVNSFFLNSLFYSFIMIWMWVIAGLTESNSRG